VLESAELGNKVDDATYQAEVPNLREALLNAQYDLMAEARFAAMVIIAGPEGAGRTDTVNLLKEWFDPRHLLVKAFGKPSDEERERPSAWRYWRTLPPKGRFGILFNAWYSSLFTHCNPRGGSEAEPDLRMRDGTIT
jgi:polyphosphate kinase 2 (PPK2 family)